MKPQDGDSKVAALQRRDVDPAVQQARRLMYRFASLSLLDPRAGSWEQLEGLQQDDLLSQAAEVIRRDPAAVPEQLGHGERPPLELQPAAVLSALPSTAGELNRQYETTFGLLVSGACPPYESEYIHEKFTTQRAQTMADIAGFYRAFGLQPSISRPERHDHIVLELEFMSVLLGMERRVVQSASDATDDRAALCRAAQERFFCDHLVWWVPAFAHLLAREAADTFYGPVARLLAALITTDRVRFGLPVPHGSVEPTRIASPDDCDGCLLAM